MHFGTTKWMILFLTFSVAINAFAKDGDLDLVSPPDELLCEEQVSSTSKAVFERLHPRAQQKFTMLSVNGNGDILKLLRSSYEAVVEDMIQSVPAKYQDEIR